MERRNVRIDAAMDSPSWLERFLKVASPVIGISSLVAVAGATVAMIWSQATATLPPLPAVAKAAPACAATTAAHLKSIGLSPERSVRFNGVDYGYRRGHVECALTRPRGQYRKAELVMCQFSNPGGLVLRTGTAEYAFAPGPSNPATVWFVDGAPRCASDSDLNIPRQVLAKYQAAGKAGL